MVNFYELKWPEVLTLEGLARFVDKTKFPYDLLIRSETINFWLSVFRNHKYELTDYYSRYGLSPDVILYLDKGLQVENRQIAYLEKQPLYIPVYYVKICA